MPQLYVCSGLIPNGDKSLSRHLIGILTLTDQNTYEFKYLLGDSPICNNLMLPIFPDKDKIYNDTETRVLLEDYLPSETDTVFMRSLLKKADMNSYDEWEWLRTFESDDPDAETCLFETLPDDVIRHDDPITLEKSELDIPEPVASDEAEDDTPEPVTVDEPDDNPPAPDLHDDIIALAYISLSEDDNVIDIHADDIQEPLPEPCPAPIAIPVPEIKSPAPVIKTHKYPHTTTSGSHHKKITVKKIQSKNNDIIPDGDFISAPPESPMEQIRQRMLEGQKQRQEKLNNTTRLS